jgi:anti-sigma factor RsiW
MRLWTKWGRHVADELSAFSDGMLPPQESARVSEHLKHCELCRKEYDEVRFGAALASHLGRASAPEGLWSSIEQRWGRTPVALSAKQQPFWLAIRRHRLAAAGTVFALGLGVVALTLTRFGLLRRANRPSAVSMGTSVSGPRTPSAPASTKFDLGAYLEPLRAASLEQSYRLISAASPGFVTLDKQEALRTAGLSALEKESPLPGYRLLAYRASRVGESRVVQLVYGKGNEAFSVFIAPRQLRFSYGKETCVDTKVLGICCQKVDCPFQKSYVFGEGRFRCALVSKGLRAEQAAAVMRYFISAHRGSQED